MSRKIMKIDLSAFFDDERKMVYILVEPNWESVACLQRRVELLFGVDSVRFLCDGCFLPPQEPIEILQFCDNIKAFVSKEPQEIKKKKSKKCKYNEKSSEKPENEENIFSESDNQHKNVLVKKRKLSCLESSNFSTNLPNKPKRSKNSHIYGENQLLPEVGGNEIDKSVNVSKVRSNYKFEEDKSYKLKSQSVGKSFGENSRDPFNYDYEYNHHSSKQESEIEKAFLANDEMETSGRPSSIPLVYRDHAHHLSKPINPNNPFKNQKNGGSHIYFEETDGILNSTPKTKAQPSSKKDKQPNPTLIFSCPLINVSNGKELQKPRIFHLNSKDATSRTIKQIVEIQEDIILPPLSNGVSIKGIDSSKQEKSLNNAKGATIIAKYDKEDQTCAKDFEVSHNQKANTETLNETEIEITGIRDITEIVNNDGDVTEAQTTSQIEQTNIQVNGAHNENKSQMHVEENLSEMQNVSQKETTNVHSHVDNLENNTQIEQNNDTEISTISVDSVDLSNDLDEVSQLEESLQIKQDLTGDDANNKSSISYIEEISEIIDLNESQDNYNYNISSRQSESDKEPTIKDILPFSIDLKTLPKPDDIIIFKVPYTKSNKTVCNTDYIAGKVQYINKRTKSIKIMIIDGYSEMRNVPSRFFYRGNDNSQDLMTYFQINLTDMHEAKLYSTS